jgi:hypothetical protein
MMTVSTRNDDIERARICLESLDRFCRNRLPLFIICPDAALEEVQTAYRGLKRRMLALEFLPDSALLAENVQSDPTVRGTVRQMLVKLAFARCCRAPFYLTLDADVALVREWGISDVIEDGRAAVQRKPIEPDHIWCNAAAELLGSPHEGTETMDVTPAILSAEGVRAMIEMLKARYGDWQRTLADRHRDGLKWTEYTLYWHFLRQTGRLEEFHRLPKDFRLFVMRSLWRKKYLEGWSLDQALKGRGYFVVLQSSTGLSVAEARAMLGMAGS